MIYVMLFIYSILALVTGKTGLDSIQKRSRKLALWFLIGVSCLTISNAIILFLNFARTMQLALQDPYDSQKYPWKSDKSETWFTKHSNVISCLKWNIAIIIISIVIHYHVVNKVIKYYLLSQSLLNSSNN